jgi:hypothetical protein
MRLVIGFFLIELMLSGCDNAIPTAAPTMTPAASPTSTTVFTPTVQGEELAFETIERAETPGTGGEYPGRDPRVVVIARVEEIDALKDTISIAAQNELRKLDFNSYFAIAVFQGLKNTNKYGVDIQRVIRNGNQIAVFAHFTERDPELEAADIITSPYHIVRVEKDGFQGEFEFFLNVDGEVILKVSSTL